MTVEAKSFMIGIQAARAPFLLPDVDQPSFLLGQLTFYANVSAISIRQYDAEQRDCKP